MKKKWRHHSTQKLLPLFPHHVRLIRASTFTASRWLCKKWFNIVLSILLFFLFFFILFSCGSFSFSLSLSLPHCKSTTKQDVWEPNSTLFRRFFRRRTVRLLAAHYTSHQISRQTVFISWLLLILMGILLILALKYYGNRDFCYYFSKYIFRTNWIETT